MLEERSPVSPGMGEGVGEYAYQRQNLNSKEIKVEVLKHFLIPNLRLGTCLVES